MQSRHQNNSCWLREVDCCGCLALNPKTFSPLSPHSKHLKWVKSYSRSTVHTETWVYNMFKLQFWVLAKVVLTTPGPWLLWISVVHFFTCAHFQKIIQISCICDFHYISEGIPSLMHFGLLMTWVLRIWFLRIFAWPKKTHEPRTWCIVTAHLRATSINPNSDIYTI